VSKKDNEILRLQSQLRDREFEIAMLRETAEAISGELDLQKVFQIVADHARKLILAETILIPVLNDELSHYTYRAGCGKNSKDIVGQTLSLDEGLCGWVFRHRRPWWQSAMNELAEKEKNRWEAEASSLILVPLVSKGLIFGGIAGINKIGRSDFTQRDLDLLELFALQVSFAVRNVELFDQLHQLKEHADTSQQALQAMNRELERRVAQRTTALVDAVKELEHLALLDTLTNLPNRSLLEDRLQQGMHLAKREQKSLSLLFIDLNHFQDVNSQYGRDAGDQVLKQVALRLKQVLRQSDTAGRLGADEFALVLPSTDEAGALKVAERLLKAMEPSIQVKNQSHKVSCRIGIAVYPKHGEDLAGLSRNADYAVLAAKQSPLGYSVFAPDTKTH